MNKTPFFEVTAGLGLRSKYREFLERMKFLGKDITFIESKSFLQSTFIIKGNYEDLKYVLMYSKIKFPDYDE